MSTGPLFSPVDRSMQKYRSAPFSSPRTILNGILDGEFKSLLLNGSLNTAYGSGWSTCTVYR